MRYTLSTVKTLTELKLARAKMDEAITLNVIIWLLFIVQVVCLMNLNSVTLVIEYIALAIILACSYRIYRLLKIEVQYERDVKRKRVA